MASDSPFLHLPAGELRNSIYEHYIDDYRRESLRLRVVRRRIPPLDRVCRIIRDEFRSLVYIGGATFGLTASFRNVQGHHPRFLPVPRG